MRATSTTETSTPVWSAAASKTPSFFCMEWNAEDQLTRVTQNSIEVARFAYDPRGRRVQKIYGGVTTGYTYEVSDILREVRGSTTVTYVQGFGVDEPLATDDGSSLSYFHADGLGSVAKTTSAAGVATSTRQYDAWGYLQQGAATGGYAYTGREWDPDTGLYYYRARYYDPSVGRFLSEDPRLYQAGESHTSATRVRVYNAYEYANDNPIRWVDPDGEAPGAAGAIKKLRKKIKCTWDQEQCFRKIDEYCCKQNPGSENYPMLSGAVTCRGKYYTPCCEARYLKCLLASWPLGDLKAEDCPAGI